MQTRFNEGIKCVKYMTITISFMFMITSILLILVGSTIQTIYTDFDPFVENKFPVLAQLLIAIGFLLLAASIFGMYGGFKESVAFLNIFALVLFLLFLMEFSAAIYAFLLPGQVSEMLMTSMNELLPHYGESEYIKETFDFLQVNLQCCGVSEPADWCSSQNETDDCALPGSCYVDENSETFYQNGCFNQLNFIISQSTVLIATGATSVALVQLLSVVCALMLAKTLRRNKTLRDMRRWQYQQGLRLVFDHNEKGGNFQ